MRILIFGDTFGIRQLLRHIAVDRLVGIVGAVIRPQYHTELAIIAESHALPLLIQPKVDSADYASFRVAVTQLAPDLIWVNSYSMILRQDILNTSRLGGINIHGALLPKYRGCNPTQWAILNGETKTGVTMHEMSSGLDEGAVIDQLVVPLFFEDTWQTVSARVSTATDELIVANLVNIFAGAWSAEQQDASQASYCTRRTPNDGLFDWEQSVTDIYNKIRALLPPLPAAFYLDTSGGKVYIEQQLTPFGVTSLKYKYKKGGWIEDKHVRLRPLSREDSALLYDGINRRDLMIFNAFFPPASKVEHDAWIESVHTKRTDLVIFVIEELAGSHSIGICQLCNIDWQNRSAELQIRIGEERYQSKGFVTEATKLLCQFGFSDLNLHRIYLNVVASNVRAIKAYEKCGFVREGLLREAAFIDDAWVDVVVLGKLEAAIK